MCSDGVKKTKILFAFDFDDTMINENSDNYILKLIPQEKPVPRNIQRLHSTSGWIDYMGQIFAYMAELGITRGQILSCLEEIECVSGLKDLFSYIKGLDGDIIIISDSNSVFIEHILMHHNLQDMVSAVFTNHSHFEGDLLTLKGYHEQDWCPMSTLNLCKGYILMEHIKQAKYKGSNYGVVAYVGDGWNDLCPSLKLSSKDLIFPRIGFALESELTKKMHLVKGTVLPWASYYDILKELTKRFPTENGL